MSHQIWFLTESILLENPDKTFTVPHKCHQTAERPKEAFSVLRKILKHGRGLRVLDF